MATNGCRPRNISPDATTPASRQGFNAWDHCMGSASTGTVCDAGRAVCPVSAAASTGAGATASAITTRICGAEQCGQKGTPSSTVCPHLYQDCSIGDQKVLPLKVSQKISYGGAGKQTMRARQRHPRPVH